MRLPCLLLCATLGMAQTTEPGLAPPPVVSSGLGRDPFDDIQLAPPGCWDALLLGASRSTPAQMGRRGEATVEVWGLAPPTSPRREAFTLYLRTLQERLSKAWLAPPPVHGAIELSEFMATNPSEPQKLDLTKVKSMQERFNRLPPNGAGVK